VRRLVCLFCLFLAWLVAWPAFAEEPVGAILLVARKDMPDPFFRNSVVLVTNATIAPLGVIINKPTDVKLSKALPEEKGLASREDKLFFGGPVAADELVFVFRAATRPEEALPVKDDLYFSTSKALLEKMLARDNPLDGLRIFAGHAGWAPGQLEGEIQRGDWHLAPADAGTVFTPKPEILWPELYSRTAATKVRYLP
jgi:putative transcriptional regulator